MYVSPNIKTRKGLIDAVKAGLRVDVYSPGEFPAKVNGIEYVEGPHYPEPHTWYAKVEVKNGVIVKVLK